MKRIEEETNRQTRSKNEERTDPHPGWRTLSVEECLDNRGHKRLPSLSLDKYQQKGEFPIIDQGSSQIAGWTDCEKAVITDELPVIVFGDHTRILKYVDFPFATGADGTKILRADEEILSPLFFYYALQNLQIPNRGYNRHYKYLRQLSLSFPSSKAEQLGIAHALRLMQSVKQARQRELTLERERKATLMEHLFRHGTRREPTQQTEIGAIPKSWEVKRLDTVAKLFSGGTPSRKRPDWWKGTIPWASPKDMKRVLLADAQEHLSEEAIKAGSRLVPAQTIFVVVRGMILAKDLPIALAEVPMAFNQDMKAVLPHNEHSSQFLLYALIWRKDELARQIGTSAHGTRRLGSSAVESLQVPVPSRSEQKEIAALLSASETRIDALERELPLREELYGAMLEQLMTGRLSAMALIEEHQAR